MNLALVRRARCSMAIALVLTVALACSPKERPNVILISIDTLRADHLSCYGYPKETSPNIDRIAGEGALFETVIAESSWTLPTHMSMLTGLTSMVHQVQWDGIGLDSKRTTLAEVLQKQGYRTKGIYTAPYLHPIYGFDQGFDEYESIVGWKAYDDPHLKLSNLTREMGMKLEEQNDDSHRHVTSPRALERSVAFVEDHQGEPFFLFLHLFDVHSDYVPPEEVWRRFDPDYRGSFSGEDFWNNSSFAPGMDPRDREHVVALYDGEIYFVDQYLQRLFARLKELDLEQNTLLVITADHGEEFLEHGLKTHRFSLYDEVLKVPLIFRQPGRVVQGAKIPQQVRQIDIMPTILSLLDVRIPEDVMGVDLSSALTGVGPIQDQPAVSRLLWPNRNLYWNSIRLPGVKYFSIQQPPESWRFQMIDPSRLPSTTDPAVLGARDAFEDFTRYEIDHRSRLEYEGDMRRDITSDINKALSALGYIDSGNSAGVDTVPPTDLNLLELELFHDLKHDPKELRPMRDGRSPR